MAAEVERCLGTPGELLAEVILSFIYFATTQKLQMSVYHSIATV